MLENTLSVPKSLLEQLHCSICNSFLSCGPIRVLPDGNCVCGRCTPLHDAPIYRVLTLETILSKISFPCRFHFRGCKSFLDFGQIQHEAKCSYRSFPCFLHCSWEGSAAEMTGHVTEKHRDVIAKKAEIRFHVDEDLSGIFMVAKEIGFIIKYHYDSLKRTFSYDVRYLSYEKEHSMYKLSLFNDSGSDCSVALKTTPCRPYCEDLTTLHNAASLDLNNYFLNLDNPSRILVRISISQAEQPPDIDMVKKLKCEVCQGYLVPPLFELDNQVLCCDCAGSHSDASILTNKRILALVCEAKFPCRWRGCIYIVKSDNYKEHEQTCQFRNYDCFFPTCTTTFKLGSAIDHLQSHRAMYSPGGLVYKMDFSQAYGIKHIFTIREDVIILIQHSVVQPETLHRIALFCSTPREIVGSVEFEHQHCKLKSRPFTVITKHKTEIALNELPSCYKNNDELTAYVHVP